MSAGRFAQAEGAYNAVLSIDPTEVGAYFGIADCAVALGRVDDAVDRLVEGAAAFAAESDTRNAFALLTKALAIAPGRMELHIDVAELEAASGRPALAVARLENLSRAYATAGDHDDAEMVLIAAEAFRPQPATPPPAPQGRPPFIDPATGREAVVMPVRRGPPPPPLPGSTLSPSTPPPAPKPVAARKAKRASGARRSAPRWRPQTAAVEVVPPTKAKRPVAKKATPSKKAAVIKKLAAPKKLAPKKLAPKKAAPKKAAPKKAAPKKAAASKRVRLSVAKAPRPAKPQRPSVPLLSSIAPAPSPSRGGKRLAQLPPLKAALNLAAQLRQAAIIPRQAEFTEDEATSLWRRPGA